MCMRYRNGITFPQLTTLTHQPTAYVSMFRAISLRRAIQIHVRIKPHLVQIPQSNFFFHYTLYMPCTAHAQIFIPKPNCAQHQKNIFYMWIDCKKRRRREQFAKRNKTTSKFFVNPFHFKMHDHHLALSKW